MSYNDTGRLYPPSDTTNHGMTGRLNLFKLPCLCQLCSLSKRWSIMTEKEWINQMHLVYKQAYTVVICLRFCSAELVPLKGEEWRVKVHSASRLPSHVPGRERRCHVGKLNLKLPLFYCIFVPFFVYFLVRNIGETRQKISKFIPLCKIIIFGSYFNKNQGRCDLWVK